MARPKGSKNKATTTAREAFNALIDGRLDDLNAWVDRVAKDDPARAFGMVMTLAAYCVPRPRPVDPPRPPVEPIVIRFTRGTSCRVCGHTEGNEPMPG